MGKIMLLRKLLSAKKLRQLTQKSDYLKVFLTKLSKDYKKKITHLVSFLNFFLSTYQFFVI